MVGPLTHPGALAACMAGARVVADVCHPSLPS